jgi:membrane protease YdiL (CAAX protease family)
MEKIKSLSWTDLILLFGVPAVLNYIACQVCIPYLNGLNLFPIEISYFISVGLIVLAPMFFGAIYLSGRDISSFSLRNIFNRMRIHKLTKQDWLWTIAAFVLLSLTSFLIAKILMPKIGLDATPFFFQNMPLKGNNMIILYVWPLFFFFNIFGEEFLWRGYIQPRQELLNKKWTWLVHGLFWAGWHLPMGIDLIVAATPIFFILPAVVQVRKNTSISIVVHAVFGGFGFLSLALGAVH